MEIQDNIIYNTLNDIIDNPIIEWEIGTSKQHYVNMNQTIDSIDESLLRNPSIPKHLDKTSYKLSNFIDKLPHGIIDKKLTGIGATWLELESKRNSIIATPTKALAYNKYMQHDKTLYVGGIYKEINKQISSQEILNYIFNTNIKHKKILVVADSLKKLINTLIEADIDVYNDYFFMVDEIDLIQEDSNYRPRLESVIDYYFLFNIKKRCLISATINNFSNPKFDLECRFNINNIPIKEREINLIHTDNINLLVKEQIIAHSTGKILIAYNSIIEIKNIINLLDEKLQEQCAVLCSEANKDVVGTYYKEFSDDCTLPNRINFITCCYFSGIDICDNYHLITVSNYKKSYQALSVHKIIQIYGRCRNELGILSDTIVQNSIGKYYNIIDSDSYKKSLLKQANKIIELYKIADDLSQGDNDIEDLFEIVKTSIQEKATAKPFASSPIPLTRKDIHNKYVPAYLNIDYLIEKNNTISTIATENKGLKGVLEKVGYKIIFTDLFDNEDYKKSSFQEEIEYRNKFDFKNSQNDLITKAIEEIKINICNHTPNDFKKYLEKRIKNSKNYEKKFFKQFQDNYIYISHEELIKLLEGIKGKNIKSYKGIRNAIIFYVLDDKHPLKTDLKTTFSLKKEYTPKEIEDNISGIIAKYHFHKTFTRRTSISLFKAFFKTSRPRTNYIILGENPLNLGAKKTTISKNENNLLKYFIL